MPRQCKESSCKYSVFGGGYCKSHQYKREKKKSTYEPSAYFQAILDKDYERPTRKDGEAQYSIDRKVFLEKPENEFCAVFPWLRANQIHHKMGREGDLLLDQRYWLAVSPEGHRKIEMSPTWAKEEGYSLSRIT